MLLNLIISWFFSWDKWVESKYDAIFIMAKFAMTLLEFIIFWIELDPTWKFN
jgi:hypothetical protein